MYSKKLRLTVRKLTSVHSECSIRKTELEEKLQAMKRKENFFWNDLQCGDPKKKAKKWRGNLRRVRSQNDMNRAVPQPPLFAIRLDIDDDALAICEAPRQLSCHEVIPETEIVEETATIMEILPDEVIPETEKLEETAIITQTFLVIPETEIVEETATIMETLPDEVIPETEKLEETAIITQTFLVIPETEIVEETATIMEILPDEVIPETEKLEETAIITQTFLVIPETEIV